MQLYKFDTSVYFGIYFIMNVECHKVTCISITATGSLQIQKDIRNIFLTLFYKNTQTVCSNPGVWIQFNFVNKEYEKWILLVFEIKLNNNFGHSNTYVLHFLKLHKKMMT